MKEGKNGSIISNIPRLDVEDDNGNIIIRYRYDSKSEKLHYVSTTSCIGAHKS